ncbi:MAG TPA: hypothetical protein VLB84_13750, partial [Bacteroidia bacterium]|nr:hypothetical protein [Bacteroidia bacterium]
MINNKILLKIAQLILLVALLNGHSNAQNRIKKIDYEYDLISGNVKQVTYQPNRPDMLIQQYSYDADNRITEVRSSTDGAIFNRDAAYTYYQHGPLARTVLGDNSVQGLDYTYTLQGWLKAVNSNVLDPSKDPGHDGQSKSGAARDVFGFSLGYYANDYNAIGGNNQFLATTAGSGLDAGNSSLYNGNIRHMVTSLTDNTGTQLPVQGNVYRYDQLNRLKQAEMYELNTSTNSFAGASASTKYKENFNYDGNGNIINLTRNGNVGLMDQLTYAYHREGDNKSNNRLLNVTDNVSPTVYSDDIDDQPNFILNDSSTWNYKYDAVGNLIFDKQEEIAEITWNVFGKIKSIHRIDGSAKSDLEFKYDASGNNRIAKIEKHPGELDDPSKWVSTYYVVGAKGETMSVYEKKANIILLKEQYVYGVQRLGTINSDIDLSGPFLPMPNSTPTFQRILGKKQYELTDYLSNVLTVISDKRSAHLNGTIPDHYEAQVISASDYYAFGSPKPGRTIHSDKYRHGFNGMEKDNEIKGNGNSYDFGERIYDPRLARWLAVDMAAKNAPAWTPYRFGFDNP